MKKDNITDAHINCDICIQSNDISLKIDRDVSYAINVEDENSMSITAENVYGFLKGIETFSQLIELDESNSETSTMYKMSGLPLTIKDSPRFVWRGLLIDTSRHWLPMRTIKRQIDAMSFFKFNVLHWHIVDAETFPLELKTAPNITQAVYHKNAVYSQDDVEEIQV